MTTADRGHPARRPGAPALPELPARGPLQEVPGLAAALGVPVQDLLVLREDLLPLAAGGNKVRKAAAALTAVARRGARVVVTTGAPQSNHARAVAVVGAQLGLDVVLVLDGDDPGDRLGNLLIDELAGARIVWAGDRPSTEVADETAHDLESTGVTVAVVPFGGSDAAAVEVYAGVARALAADVPDLRHVVVAVGSGATAAGLVAELGDGRVLGVDTGAVPDARSTVAGLLEAARPGGRRDRADLRLDTTHVGRGYDDVPWSVLDAVRLALTTDGVLFDVTYAGRALAATAEALRSGAIGPGERTVLVHTGGAPGLFGRPGAFVP